jgi:hypothetical protein
MLGQYSQFSCLCSRINKSKKLEKTNATFPHQQPENLQVSGCYLLVSTIDQEYFPKKSFFRKIRRKDAKEFPIRKNIFSPIDKTTNRIYHRRKVFLIVLKSIFRQSPRKYADNLSGFPTTPIPPRYVTRRKMDQINLKRRCPPHPKSTFRVFSKG